MKDGRDSLVNLLGAVSLVGIVVALFMVFVYVPTEREMGIVQRVFYFHVPSATVAFLSFFIVFVTSIAYLFWRKERRLDIVAASAAEIGVVFTTLVLIEGSLWAKPIWGAWWIWEEPRLVTALVLWLIYVGYLMLRGSIADPTRRATFSAVLGIIGFIDVPIVFMSIRWWRSIHPVVISGSGMNLDPSMLLTFFVSLGAFVLFFAYLLVHKVRIERLRDDIEELKQAVG
ncbi:MAG: cytochrome c biogenesis protein [Terriglobia bacterium]